MAGNVFPLRTVEDEASDWVARTEHGCTPEQRKRLDMWLAADPEHRTVFEEMSKQWQRLGATAEIAARLNHLSSPSARPREGLGEVGPGFRRPYLGWGLAASAILIALLAISQISQNTDPKPETYATEVGVHRTIALTDGSAIELNTATRIEVQFTPAQRLIHLTAGEALFKAAPDPARPFTVIAGSSIVRAVGTAFAIRIDSDRTNVLVTEGRVLVSPLQSPTSAAVAANGTNKLLSAGELVSITTAIGQIAKVESHDLNRTLAWRRGVLNIQDQPLGEVIAEVERYTATRIIIADPQLTNIKVGGYFKATDIEAFLTLVQGQFPIAAERAGPDLIVLRHIPD